MKRLITVYCAIILWLVFAAPAFASGELSITPVFGKITYEDSDSNGFADAAWIGLQLQGDWELSPHFLARVRYDYGFNDDAVGQDLSWNTLVPGMTTGGELSQQKQLYALLYSAGLYRFGFGYLIDGFRVTEYGFAEHRDYRGFCLVAEARFGKERSTQVGLLYGPSLTVDDDVKGDWDDADRTAAVSYAGSYWELLVDHTFVSRDRFNLAAGFNCSVLSGDGADHDEYRFLEHDLTLKNFYVRADWKF